MSNRAKQWLIGFNYSSVFSIQCFTLLLLKASVTLSVSHAPNHMGYGGGSASEISTATQFFFFGG